jgi:N6-L-threonylcarbamoyladenine synthase
VLSAKNLSNITDAVLTLKGGQNMFVFVKNKRDEPLMPCSPRKARVLLKKGKAKVVKRTPFTIQLTIPTGETKQDITLGVDSGFTHVGLSAVSNKEELFSADVTLRSDMVKLNSERAMYRRSRRGRKTRYRKPRFLNRVKFKGWLAPSIQHKLDSHKKLIDMVKGLLPITKTIIEVAAFDIQKIKNPDILGIGYQNGDKTGFWNVREYVLYRDSHKCQAPKCNHKDKVLNVHHIVSRQTGGDRPNNLITLCENCHSRHHKGEIDLKIKRTNGFKAETFMSMVRWRLTNETDSQHTFGYITKSNRIATGLDKSHSNDAFIIAGGVNQLQTQPLIIKQVRKCNRKLYKGARSHVRNVAAREIKGFRRFDKVLWNDKVAFVFGRRTTGNFDIRDIHNNSLHKSISFKQLGLLERSNTLIVAYNNPNSSPCVNAGVSLGNI